MEVVLSGGGGRVGAFAQVARRETAFDFGLLGALGSELQGRNIDALRLHLRHSSTSDAVTFIRSYAHIVLQTAKSPVVSLTRNYSQ